MIVVGLVPPLSPLYMLNYKKDYFDASVLSKITLHIGTSLASFAFTIGNAVD